MPSHPRAAAGLLLSVSALLNIIALLLTKQTVAAQGTTPFTGDIQPKTRPLTPLEYQSLQSSEVSIEYELLEAHAEKLGLTVEELTDRSTTYWYAASEFEYGRALQSEQRQTDTDTDKEDEAEPFPYLICRSVSIGDIGGETSTAAAPPETGRAHRLALDDAITEAYVNAGYATDGTKKDPPKGSTISLHPTDTLYNADGTYCAFARLVGSVALEIDCASGGEGGADEVECAVQPVLTGMKLTPDSIQRILDAHEEFYADEEEEEGDGEAVSSITSDMNGTATPEETDGPTPFPEPDPAFPTADILLCPGMFDEDDLADYKAGGDEAGRVIIEDISTSVTDWILASTATGEASSNGTSPASENFFWTSQAAKELYEQYGTNPERAALLGEVLNAAIGTNLCTDTFSSNLQWTAVLSQRAQTVQGALRVQFVDPDANEVDKACVLSLIIALTTLPTVCMVDITPTRVPLNDRAQWLIQSFQEEERPFSDVGITGEGQIVAVSDTGVDVNNCYFLDATARPPNAIPNNDHRKIVQYVPFVDDSDYEFGHGTHVSGTVLGKKEDGTGIADGVASGAKLAFFDIGTKRGLLRLPQDDSILLGTGRVSSMETKAHIHSASWGSMDVNFYDFQSRSFDDIMFENDDLLVNVAAGNSGRFNKVQTVSSPAVAKNIMSVGSSHSANEGLAPKQLDQNYLSDFSSRGTTADGRIKPDIVAPGEMILSAGARPDQIGACDELGVPLLGSGRGGLVWMAGTSMATPALSGAAALVREYFEKGYYPGGTEGSGPEIMPSAALVKAVLMNGAQWLQGVDNPALIEVYGNEIKPYDIAQGFGRASLIDSLHLAGKSNVRTRVWDRQTIDDANLLSVEVTIDMSGGCTSKELRTTLVWSEIGGSVGCARCVLNDLDLFIIPKADTSTIHYPNGLSKRDSLNNNERVVVPNVSDGETYTIFVEGHNLNGDTQDYSLVVTGCIANEVGDGGVFSKPDFRPPIGSSPEGEDEDGVAPDLPDIGMPGVEDGPTSAPTDVAEGDGPTSAPIDAGDPEGVTSSGTRAVGLIGGTFAAIGLMFL